MGAIKGYDTSGQHITKVILLMVAGVIFSIIFLALWNPGSGDGLRDHLYNLVNDSDFTTTYGTGIRDGLTYIIDLVPLLLLFAIFGILSGGVIYAIKKGL